MKMCKITNRSAGVAAYFLPETNTLRQFYPKETKTVPYSEIEAVSAQSGGRELLYNYFYIDDSEVIQNTLNVKPEPEYYLQEDNIDNWIQTCSLDEFKDALDFAPEGVKALIREHSVSLPLNDLQKCEALRTQLGFDCLQAIKNERATQAADPDDNEEVHASRRRVVSKLAEPESERRITPKCNVVKKEEK